MMVHRILGCTSNMPRPSKKAMYVVKGGDYGGSFIIQFGRTTSHRKFLRLPEQELLDVPLSAFDSGRKNGVLDFVANIDKDVYNYCKHIYDEKNNNI